MLKPTDDKEKDLYDGVVRINQAVEQLVRQAPEQDLWDPASLPHETARAGFCDGGHRG
ncbi:MAG: hypothetical protein ABIP94_08890 [Planctomycetota bacterium]